MAEAANPADPFEAFRRNYAQQMSQVAAAFFEEMTAQTEAAVAGIRSRPADGGPSDVDILRALQSDPELRKAVVALMQKSPAQVVNAAP